MYTAQYSLEQKSMRDGARVRTGAARNREVDRKALALLVLVAQIREDRGDHARRPALTLSLIHI